ncbi:MAG TPA: Ku protein [Gaiellaceae bacterium]|nr:Ku protein [Gaiellaceae bacterium]
MPRAIWSGSIAFGLVNAPVKMYAAIDEHNLELHMVHEKDGSPIGYEKVCKKEDKPVPADEIVKAYEVSEDEYVYLTDEDFKAAEEESYRTIEILAFVPRGEIDPIVFKRTYYLGPAEGAEKVYALLVKAMESSGLSAVARYVFHDRQQLGTLRIREGVITLENMYFADEIRPAKDVAPSRQPRVDKQELEMAETLIERFTSSFRHEQYEDEYRKRLLKIVKRKQKGEEIHAEAPAEEREEPTDILEALRASVEAARSSGSRNGRKNRRAKKTTRKRRTPAKSKS